MNKQKMEFIKNNIDEINQNLCTSFQFDKEDDEKNLAYIDSCLTLYDGLDEFQEQTNMEQEDMVDCFRMGVMTTVDGVVIFLNEDNYDWNKK